MIQPPLEACRHRKWETFAVAFAVVVVVAIPVSIALFALCAQSAATQWLSSYTPIVYLESDTSAESAQQLAEELRTWPLVGAVEIREPAAAFEALNQRLGADVVTELGIAPTMLPTSLIIEPALPLVGHVDLVSRVSGLEARADVDAVEVPSSSAMQVVSIATIALVVAGLLGLFGLLAALVLLASYLERLRGSDDELDRVVALFGGYSSELRKPTLVRGSVVGGACGAFVTLGGAVVLMSWQLWSSNFLGTSLSAPTVAWVVVAVPLLAIPVLGLLAAYVASREPVQIWRGANA